MAIHDWTRVPDGIFHHFHVTWLVELAGQLNDGILPAGYYALGEQIVTGAVPDVLTLERGPASSSGMPSDESAATLPEPTATVTATATEPRYPPRPRVLSIRHVTGDRVVAIVEIVSSGNKKDASEVGALVEKTILSLSRGVHVVVVDLHPPGPFDPEGMHNVVWAKLDAHKTPFDPERPLQFVSYVAGDTVKAYLEPRAVGEELPELPLFLTRRRHIRLPLSTSYAAAFARVPSHLREIIERR